jgi:hypothetical protein
MLATDGNEYEALNNVLLNSDVNLKTRQPQWHCAHREKKQVLVEAVWIYQNYKSFGTPGAKQNFKIKSGIPFGRIPPKAQEPLFTTN